MATLSATGKPEVRAGFDPLLPGFRYMPYNDIPALEKLDDAPDRVVAVMLEAVQGEGGVIVPDPGYLQGSARALRPQRLAAGPRRSTDRDVPHRRLVRLPA